MGSTRLVAAAVVSSLVSMGSVASVTHAAIIPQTFSGTLEQDLSVSTPGTLPINETWSTTNTSPFTISRWYDLPTGGGSPWAQAIGSMSTTATTDSFSINSAFTAEASTQNAPSDNATARSVSVVTFTFTVTQAGPYVLRGGSNVTAEGFLTFNYTTSVILTGPITQTFPAVDGPFNPNQSFMRELPVGLYTVNMIGTIACESSGGSFGGLAGSTKFEISAVPTPGVLGLGVVAGLVAVRRRR